MIDNVAISNKLITVITKQIQHISAKRHTSNILVVSVAFFIFFLTTPSQASYDSFSKLKLNHNNLRQQRVFLLSFGGFRHDYIQSYNLRNFMSFMSDGVKALHLDPQFTTQTFPNHWSMATGSYVETHGIIANKFYDPLYDEFFSQHKHDIKWWNETGEPIWFTSARQGVKTGVYFWPGSECVFQNLTGLYTRKAYNDNTPFHIKVNQTINWFLHEDYKFVAMYHNQPDAIAHKYAINSPEFNVTLNQLDESFGLLMDHLKRTGLYYASDFNIIVVSDHGMINVKKNIIVSDYFNENDAAIWSFSRNLIHLKPLIDVDQLLLKLSKIPDITITLKEDMPERLHYKNNRRIGDIIISALEGIGFIYIGNDPIQLNQNGRISNIQLNKEQKRKLLIAAADKATHGYDKSYLSMKGIFLGRGSMFKKNFSSESPVENVDVHPLICNILAIECEIRNGSFDRVKRFLKYEHRLVSWESDRQRYEFSKACYHLHINYILVFICLYISYFF